MFYSRHTWLEQHLLEVRDQWRQTGIMVITGPSGSGKTHLAEAMHAAIAPKHPLMFQSLSGFSEALFESRLFGHVKGAFSGASADFAGLLGATGEGVLCLEAADQLPEVLQSRLLRFLQTKRYRPVGATSERVWRGRLIFTTQTPPDVLRSEGRWREDFYFRLQTTTATLPAASERQDDFEAVCAAMLERIGGLIDLNQPLPTPAQCAPLKSQSIPGNYHGLFNTLQRAAIQGKTPALPPQNANSEKPSQGLPNTGSLKGDMQQVERQLLIRALSRHQGSRQELAEKLGISRRALMYKLKEFDLS